MNPSLPLRQQDDQIIDTHSESVEGPLPSEVAPAEAVCAVENQQAVKVHPPKDVEQEEEVVVMPSFTWKIENFSSLNAERHYYSDVFTVAGYNWRVKIYPKGGNVDHYLAMYLEVADSDKLPYGWIIYGKFSLAIVNQINDRNTVKKISAEVEEFNAQKPNRGCPRLLHLMDLKDPARGYLVNDTCIVEADVVVDRKMTDYWTYDSKKETGYVGLKNQGATCYMNSLLQMLYHIPYFRKAVYNMPTTEDDSPSESIPLALQFLFYKIQYGKNSVSTKNLTKSFGWDTIDSFKQHDVTELNRVLCEKLEDKMKGTVVEGTIQHLFEGHHMNYIECINVDYRSTRKESFYDLQLDVKGCVDVYASFDKFVEVERLEGDNKYHADEQHGLQDAKKGVLFTDFPPVLQLQLKRYEYDLERDAMVKINDRYEFPLQLDLDREDGKYLSPDVDRRVRNLYTLHGVLVHRGVLNGGHYYALIRPTLSEEWFKFNDERVTKEDIKHELEEQYGGETKYSSAYMLVYIRETDRDKILCNVDENDIAEHLMIRLKKKQEEKEIKERKKKEEAEDHLYAIIKVARNEDLSEQIGRDIFFDLVDHEKVCSFRINKQTPFNHFKEEVAKEFGVPVPFQRFWLWVEYENNTHRLDRPLTLQEETQSVGKLKGDDAELKLFLEIELGPDLHPVPPPHRTKEDILLFFKLYDAEKEEIRYVGRIFVKKTGKPLEILQKLNEMAGFSPDEEIELYEEVCFEPTVKCDHINKKVTFGAFGFADGDIICFQKTASSDSMTLCRYPNVPSFLKYVRNRQVVHFRSLEKPEEDAFCLELSMVYTYDDVTERVAHHLCLDDPTKIRLTPHNCYSQKPYQKAIKYQGVGCLSEMLTNFNQTSDRTSDILYYEVLEIPLPELQSSKTLKVAFHDATKNDMVVHSIRLYKRSTVSDLISHLKTKVNLSHPDAELRLLEIWNYKICKIFQLSDTIESLDDKYSTLRAEEIPVEEKNLGPQDRLIHVYHFTKILYMQVSYFGDPFFLGIHEGETLGAVKLRIKKKLQVAEEEFSKWKFAYISCGRIDYLLDSDIVSIRFKSSYVHGVGAPQQYLGLEHSDISLKRASAANPNLDTPERKRSKTLQLG